MRGLSLSVRGDVEYHGLILLRPFVYRVSLEFTISDGYKNTHLATAGPSAPRAWSAQTLADATAKPNIATGRRPRRGQGVARVRPAPPTSFQNVLSRAVRTTGQRPHGCCMERLDEFCITA